MVVIDASFEAARSGAVLAPKVVGALEMNNRERALAARWLMRHHRKWNPDEFIDRVMLKVAVLWLSTSRSETGV